MSKILHTTIRNNKLFCMNCGGDHPFRFPLPVDKMSEKIAAFNNLHADCPKTWTDPVVNPLADETSRANWWIANGRVGMSSKAIWSFFMKVDEKDTSHPYDPDDFGRCYRLLQVVPEWRARIKEMGAVSTAWKNLSENWEKLTAMYEQNVSEDWKNYKKIGMYEFMQTLI